MRVLGGIFWITISSGFLIGWSLMRLLTPEPPHIPTQCPEGMVCYEAYGPPVEPEYILNGSLVVVQWVAEEDMPDGYEAYAQYSVDFENNASYCLITTTMPEQVLGDSKMDALGHELLHCITGAFHP
jgi:hypothetical protein